uniref:Hexosyltransferase n=1 Tax=Hucho hucho TaxID=62062 RepID=A0A4W5MTU3_9TELE
MARCRCNGTILCLCLMPCVMMGHLLVYIMVSIFVSISYSPPHLPVHFVAPGASANSGALASHPLGPFWNLRLEDSALWNQLQHHWDRHHNPILRGNSTAGMIRSGWVKGEHGGRGGLVRTVFLLGRQDSTTGPHPDLGGLLMLESQRYGDILQWDFRDTFFNLTLKDLLFWHWLQNHCPGAQFVFKGDDDVFVRTSALLDYLHKQREENGMWSNAMPNRQPTTKYYISESFYKGAYPPYAGGGGVVYSGALAMRLRQVSERVRLFPIDDVYLGMCLHRLGVAPIHHPGFYTFDLPETEREKPCAYSSVLLVHKRNPKEMLTLWKWLQNRNTFIYVKLRGSCYYRLFTI